MAYSLSISLLIFGGYAVGCVGAFFLGRLTAPATRVIYVERGTL